MLELIPRASVKALTTDPIVFLPLDLLSWRVLPRVLWTRARLWLWAVRARAVCRLLGHQLTRRAWVHERTRVVGEYHVGCTRCSLFWTESPEFKRTKEPHYFFL